VTSTFGRKAKAQVAPVVAQAPTIPDPEPENIPAQGPAGPTTVATVPNDMAAAINALLQR
jgi:hypothetical protein